MRTALASLVELYPVVLSGALQPLKAPDTTPQPLPATVVDSMMTHDAILFAPAVVDKWVWPPITVPW